MERYAIVIGINGFSDAAFGNLHFAENDARDVASLLIGEMQWKSDHVKIFTGNSERKAGSAKLEFEQLAEPNKIRTELHNLFIQEPIPYDSLLLFYYAGHGFLDRRHDRGYLAFSSTLEDDPTTGLAMDDVFHYVNVTKARNVLVILDCCHSGAIWQNGNGGRGESSNNNAISLIGQDAASGRVQGRIILVACSVNQTSREHPSLSHGVFTSELLEGWRGGDSKGALDARGKVTVDSLYAYLDQIIPERYRELIKRYPSDFPSPFYTPYPQKFGGPQQGVLVLNERPKRSLESRPPDAHDNRGIIPSYVLQLKISRKTAFEGWKINGVDVIEPPTVLIPAGPFQMGSRASELEKWPDKETFADEYSDKTFRERHSVEVDDFRMGVFPVTVAEYGCFIRSGNAPCVPENWDKQFLDPTLPVVYISWIDACAYCIWLSEKTGRNYRLPTEAEWEKAARWDSSKQYSRIYPWSDQWGTGRCNTSENQGDLMPIGSYPKGVSKYALHDLAGNVWEWTSSIKLPYPYNRDDGRENWDSTAQRIVRGGSYAMGYAGTARCAYRGLSLDRNKGYDDVGFRLARIV